jgi:hypothetical protein
VRTTKSRYQVLVGDMNYKCRELLRNIGHQFGFQPKLEATGNPPGLIVLLPRDATAIKFQPGGFIYEASVCYQYQNPASLDP